MQRPSGRPSRAQGKSVLGVEVSFDTRLLNPATWRPSSTWRPSGKVNLLLRDRASGRVLVCEHKTTGDSMEDSAAAYWSRLQMDFQISGYVIGAPPSSAQAPVLADVPPGDIALDDIPF